MFLHDQIRDAGWDVEDLREALAQRAIYVFDRQKANTEGGPEGSLPYYYAGLGGPPGPLNVQWLIKFAEAADA